MQSFVVGNDIGTKQATLAFTGDATAGNMTSYTNYGFAGLISFEDNASAATASLVNSVSDPFGRGGLIQFTGNSTADHASFVNSGTGNSGPAGEITFLDNATASYATFSSLAGLPPPPSVTGTGGLIQFFGSSTADHATFVCEGAQFPSTTGGTVAFFDGATAANSTFTIKGGEGSGLPGGFASLSFGADSGDATFTINGGQVSGALGGSMVCEANTGNATFLVNGATVSGALGATLSIYGGLNATIIANPSANGGGAADVQAFSSTIAARIELFGDGSLSAHSRTASVGSIEGDGKISLGPNNLSVGRNNLSTTFSGIIEGGDTGRSGMLNKIGTGTLTLTGANTYTGGTIVEAGILLANNTVGSGTGANTVQVNAGTFGGGGKVSGNVIVGTGSGTGAILGPGARGIIPGTLTIQRKLTLLSDATYKCTLDSSVPSVDQVRAKGVSIQEAQIVFDDRSNTSLAAGTVFTVVSNTARTPIAGTFANLPDGAAVTIGNNTYQVSYSGGDGNDLTLTVVP
jgi:autotransporter-associated beta strand protein